MFKKITLMGTLLLLILSTQSSPSTAKQVLSTTKNLGYKNGEILVKYKTEDNAVLNNTAEIVGIDTGKKKLANNRTYLLTSPSLKAKVALKKLTTATVMTSPSSLDDETQSIINALKRDPSVIYAEPNYERGLLFTPNDTRFADQYDFNNTGQTGGTVDADIDAVEGWDVEQGSSSVLVAIIDTGVFIDHPDLDTKIARDGSNNVIGYDFVNNDANPDDDHGHGTHCAGTIAAETNNSLGVAGVCPNCKIIPLKFLSASGSGSTSDAVLAFQYAIDNGADVISNSWGGGGYDQALQDIITEAHARGILVVFAAGNENNDYPGWAYPASMQNVIAVAATDHNDQKAYFSNYDDGSGWVDVSAPGVDTLSTVPTGTCSLCDASGYTTLSGTSMAAPHVAGLFGLLRSQKPGASVADLETQLFMTADDIDGKNPGYEGLLGMGRMNIYKALTIVPGPNIILLNTKKTDYIPDGNGDTFIQPGEKITLETQLKNAWKSASNVHFTLSSSDPYTTITQNTGYIPTFSSGTITAPSYSSDTVKSPTFVFTYDVAGPSPHVIDFSLSTIADGGYSTTETFSVHVESPVSIPITWNFSDAQSWESSGQWYLTQADCFPSSVGNVAPYWFFGASSCQAPNEWGEANLYSPPIQGTLLSTSSYAPISLKFLHTERCSWCSVSAYIKQYGADDNTATLIGTIESTSSTKAWATTTFIIPTSLYQQPYYQIFFAAQGGETPIGFGIDNVSITKDTMKIIGFVQDSVTNAPVENADVVLDGITTGVKSGSDGSFALANVSTGSHIINASKLNYRQNTNKTISVPASGSVTTSIILTYATNGSLSGKVLNDSNFPLGGVIVTARSLDTFDLYSTVTSSSGIYTFSSLPHGQYTLDYLKTMLVGSLEKTATLSSLTPYIVYGGQKTTVADTKVYINIATIQTNATEGVVGSSVNFVYSTTLPLDYPSVSTTALEGEFSFVEEDFTYLPASMSCEFLPEDNGTGLYCSARAEQINLLLHLPLRFQQTGSITLPLTTRWEIPGSNNFYSLYLYYTVPVIAPSATPTATNTATKSHTASATKTASSTSTPTSTKTSTSTRTATKTKTATFTATGTNTATNTWTPSRTRTATNTPTPTFTRTPSNTRTATKTKTATFTATGTNTATNTWTPSRTRTATNTPSPTFTRTPSNTRTATFTKIPTKTMTATRTKIPTKTKTPSITMTATITQTPSATLVVTATPTPINTQEITPTPTYTITVSSTETPSETPTIIATETETFTPSYTITFSPTDTPMPTSTTTETPTISATDTPSETVTETPTETATDTPTEIPTVGGLAFEPTTIFSIGARATVEWDLVQ